MCELKWIFVLVFLIKTSYGTEETKFPDNFKFGIASSAYQTEGAWNASGKGENIWDRFLHEHPKKTADHENADIACESYRLWHKDVELLKELGVQHYRFSISWTRILPTGFPNHVNDAGVKYYNELIDSLIKNNIDPFVTLYHFDLPQRIQDLGGWTNIQTATYFANYARVAFRLFGDRVKLWTTINEPSTICEEPYENNQGAPSIHSPGIGLYLCGHTILIAHAKAFHVYDKEFRKDQGGQIGITIDSIWAEPRSNRTEDIDAASRELTFALGWWAHPIFSAEGDYPPSMKSRIEERSLKEGFAESRLPSFTKEEIESLKGSADFFGLNHYFTWLIHNQEYPIGEPGFFKDKGVGTYENPNMLRMTQVAPWGFYNVIKYITKEYNNPTIVVTENGYPDVGQLNDTTRAIYLQEFMQSMLKTINEGSNVTKYTAWSLLDSFEWTLGYTKKYGLFHVAHKHPNKIRIPKATACFYKKVIQTRRIPGVLEILDCEEHITNTTSAI